MQGSGGIYLDETIFRTKTGTSTNFDPANDAYKLYSFDYATPNISTLLNGREYVVNSIDNLFTNFDLPVKINVTVPGSYTINFKGLINFNSLNCFTFEDKLTHAFINLNSDSSYTFTSAIDTVSANSRFVLHFGVAPILSSAIPSATTLGLPGNANVSFANTSTGASSFVWDFGDGSALDSSLSPSHTYTAVGVYTVILIASNAAGCSQSSTFQINVDDVTGIQNEVVSESMTLSKESQGIFANYNFKSNTVVKISIYNMLGKQIGTTQTNNVQSKGRFAIKAPEAAKGIYFIELIYKDKKVKSKFEF